MKTAFWSLSVIGFALCSGAGIGAVARRFGGEVPWGSPFMLAGYLLGVVALAVIASPFLGWKLPYVSDYKSGAIALAVLVAAKIVLTQAHLATAK